MAFRCGGCNRKFAGRAGLTCHLRFSTECREATRSISFERERTFVSDVVDRSTAATECDPVAAAGAPDYVAGQLNVAKRNRESKIRHQRDNDKDDTANNKLVSKSRKKYDIDSKDKEEGKPSAKPPSSCVPIKQEATLLADTVVSSDQVGDNTKSDSDNKEGNQEPAEPVARLNAVVKEEHHHGVDANNDNDGVGNPDDDEDSFYSRWPGLRPPPPSFFDEDGRPSIYSSSDSEERSFNRDPPCQPHNENSPFSQLGATITNSLANALHSLDLGGEGNILARVGNHYVRERGSPEGLLEIALEHMRVTFSRRWRCVHLQGDELDILHQPRSRTPKLCILQCRSGYPYFGITIVGNVVYSGNEDRARTLTLRNLRRVCGGYIRVASAYHFQPIRIYTPRKKTTRKRVYTHKKSKPKPPPT